LLVAPEWKVLAEFFHETTISSQSVSIFVESESEFVSSESPCELQQTSRSGIIQVKWAIGNRLLATVSARTPTSVFLWNTETVSLLGVIVCRSEISQIEWSPVDEILSNSTRNGFVIFWSPSGVSYVRTPESVRVVTIEWRNDGRQLAVIDNEAGTYAIADRYG
jgi:WD40 repeat protein